MCAVIAAATASLATCGCPGYPPTVFEGTAAVVAWDGALTSVNAASASGATPGYVGTRSGA